jgi:hypothetical protein
VICDIGNNLVPEVPTLSYTIEDENNGPVVAWGAEPIPITAAEVLRAQTSDADERAEHRECEEWLREMLSDGRLLVKDLERAAKDAGMDWHALKRAKRRIHAKSQRDGYGADGGWFWSLGHACNGDTESR